MTIDIPMEDAYRQWMDDRQAERDFTIGPSGSHTCYRQQAYMYLEVPSTRKKDTNAADLGTLLHLGWSAMIRSQFDPEVRRPDVSIMVPGLPRAGSADDVDYVNHVVTDLKSAKDRVWQMWLNQGSPYDSYWDQVELYALGLRSLLGGDWTMRIVAFNRETGQKQEYERPADPEVGAAIAAKIERRHAALMVSRREVASGASDVQAELDLYPREGRGPGMGMPCDWCPFMDQCWQMPPQGEGGPSTPQAFSVREDATAVGEWAREYVEARTTAGKHYDQQKQAGEFLRGIEGVFPDANGVSYRIGMSGGKPSTAPDCEAMIERLESLGERPIFKEVTTPSRLSVRVVSRPK